MTGDENQEKHCRGRIFTLPLHCHQKYTSKTYDNEEDNEQNEGGETLPQGGKMFLEKFRGNQQAHQPFHLLFKILQSVCDVGKAKKK